MADAKRQVGIKTRSVKRLAADVRSYMREKATHEDAYAAASAPGSGLAANDVKRARDFVDEADATLADVRQRLQESWQMLTHFLAELQAGGLHADLMADACVAEARAMLREVGPLVNVPASVEAPVARPLKVCVLGDSQLNEDDAFWRPTEQLGELLLLGGFHVLSGGYSGTSEAVCFGASRGAASSGRASASASAAAAISGVTCPAAFVNTPRGGASGPHQYLTEQVPAADLFARTSMLVRPADAVVVMPGGLGTLSKVVAAWNHAAVEIWNGSPAQPRVILAWREPWQALIESIGAALRIQPDLLACIKYVSSVEEIMAELEQLKARNEAAGGAAAASAASSSSASAASSSSSK